MSYRVFCPDHDLYNALYTEGRPLLDGRCPQCRIDLLEKRNAELEASDKVFRNVINKLANDNGGLTPMWLLDLVP